MAHNGLHVSCIALLIMTPCSSQTQLEGTASKKHPKKRALGQQDQAPPSQVNPRPFPQDPLPTLPC